MPIIIKAKRNNFRRCGVAHPAKAVEHPDGRFSEKELAVLKAEPMLVMTITKPAAKPKTTAPTKPAAKPKTTKAPAKPKTAKPAAKPKTTKPAAKKETK